MNVLMLNGSPRENGCTCTALKEIQKVLKQQSVESEIIWIGAKPVSGCIACGKCKDSGVCVFQDGVNQFAEKARHADGFIFGSPVYYASATGQITSFLDRLFHSAGSVMAGKPGASVVSCRRGGASAAFDQLNKYFLINNMPLIPSLYWNQVHGNSPEEVLQDLEGIQTMQYIGENMAWILKCMEAGRNAGVKSPVYASRTMTNFIR